ncbi:MAG TPA: hypothetical protein VI357_16755 [Mycobacteriales bacterium]
MSRYAALILFTAAVLAACSSGDEPTALPPGPDVTTLTAATTAAPTTAAATPSPTTGTRRAPIRWTGPAATGAKAPVQEATRAYWSMVVRLAEKPDPADPAITALSVPPQRERLVSLYGNIRRQGLSQRGPIAGAVTVSAVSGTRATAATCLDQSLVRVYDRAGRARPGSSGSVQQFSVSLTRTGGAWKVAGVADAGACTLPAR